MSAAGNLTRAQKAAAILVAMGKPAASRLLKFFKQEELKALIEGARMLRTIPQSDLEAIVAEFEGEFTEGAGLLDSADRMDTMLKETLSAEEMSALMSDEPKSAADAGPPPVWPALAKLDPARLGSVLSGEHPQTAAVVLSKLPPPTAANVMVTLEKSFRADVIRRMMAIATVPEPALRIIEESLRTRVLAEGATKDTGAGQARVATLLNELDKNQLEEVMQDLAEAGTSNLDALRSRLFSFEDVIRLSQKARVTLFDGLSSELVTKALHNSDPALVEAVLSAIGARARRMIEAELGQGADGIAAADIIQARKSIASTAIRMASEGSFELPSAETAAA
jgi:flagellar motor switch protein FliG